MKGQLSGFVTALTSNLFSTWVLPLFNKKTSYIIDGLQKTERGELPADETHKCLGILCFISLFYCITVSYLYYIIFFYSIFCDVVLFLCSMNSFIYLCINMAMHIASTM